jgi:hypothetical protein
MQSTTRWCLNEGSMPSEDFVHSGTGMVAKTLLHDLAMRVPLGHGETTNACRNADRRSLAFEQKVQAKKTKSL